MRVAEKIAKGLLILTLFIAFFPLSSSNVFAAENFTSEYDVSYTVVESGLTTVKQEVTITNLTSQFFVSKYSFTIGSEDIRNIKAWDPTGTLTPQIETKGEETVITLNFRARVFGKGRKLKFGISYDFPGLASKNGLLWEVSLLRITGLSGIVHYNLHLSVPKNFGPLLYSYPQPKAIAENDIRRLILYTKSELLKGPPRLAFGKFQLYELHLNYHLENSSFALGYTEIALPPDIPNQQQIVVKNLSPKPVSVRLDEDGNYLARYNLGPWEKKEIVWEGFIALYYHPRDFSKSKIEVIPQTLVDTYTTAAKYWEVEDAAIVAQAQKLIDPNLSAAENAKRIFDFVVKHLSYDYPRFTAEEFWSRLGAATALQKNNQAVCMEYTDLFIALARAAGIPAREVNGFAYTSDDSHRPLSLRFQGGDVLHAWPEVYLPEEGWVMVDPTWSSTSGADYFSVFDLSHIAFVIKGASSEYPLPAGSYQATQGQRDVRVAFSKEVTMTTELPRFAIEVVYPLLSVAPFSTSATIKVRNDSVVSAFNTQITVASDLLEIDGEGLLDLGTIPPLGTKEVKVRLVPQSFRTKGKQQLEVGLAAFGFSGEKVTSAASGETTINPLYLPLSPLYLVAAGGTIILFGLLARFLVRVLL